ncbi:rhodanese family protein [Pelagibius sp. Alg239-R121]|uniref:rhodanese-like domain-containing protein n=1 Tax=Pelagibius sp. Alg239-R121 TaxID=2993448 RepID=UPI0024A62116|nr:rhodanese family protein [Pelagibius sp. Alg239-R121]
MSGHLREIDAASAKHWLDLGKAKLFDIREADEFRREHIAGAQLLPSAQLIKAVPNGNDQGSDPEIRIAIFHCNSGQRTREAASDILRCGYDEIYALQGGLSGWKSAGLATELNRKAPISLQRQVQMTAGSMVVMGILLAWLISPWFALLSGFVGAGLVFAGLTNTCALARLLAQLPYNRRAEKRDEAQTATNLTDVQIVNRP